MCTRTQYNESSDTHRHLYHTHAKIQTHRQTQHSPTTDTDIQQNHPYATCMRTQLRDIYTARRQRYRSRDITGPLTHIPHYDSHTYDDCNTCAHRCTQKYRQIYRNTDTTKPTTHSTIKPYIQPTDIYTTCTQSCRSHDATKAQMNVHTHTDTTP